MTDTVLVALIGVGGTLLGMFGNSIVERAKAKSERRLYITKVRFDHEFEIYQTIFYKGIMPSEKVSDLPVDCNTLAGSVNL